MRLPSVTLTIAACITLAVLSVIHAHEPPEAKRTFFLRTTPEPADPDPAAQSIAERTATLRNRMQEAKAHFDAGEVEQCLNEYVDPFWLARAAAGSGGTIDELIEKQILKDRQRADEFASAFAMTIESNLEAEPTWLLGGRVASFMTSRSSHTAEFWIYFEGKWRISPET